MGINTLHSLSTSLRIVAATLAILRGGIHRGNPGRGSGVHASHRQRLAGHRDGWHGRGQPPDRAGVHGTR